MITSNNPSSRHAFGAASIPVPVYLVLHIKTKINFLSVLFPSIINFAFLLFKNIILYILAHVYLEEPTHLIYSAVFPISLAAPHPIILIEYSFCLLTSNSMKKTEKIKLFIGLFYIFVVGFFLYFLGF